MKYELDVNMKAFNQNKAMAHRIVGIFEDNTREIKIAKRYMEWSKLYDAPKLP